MKKYLLPLIVLSAFMSCKDNPVSKKISETRQTVSNTTNAVKEMTRIQDDIKDLSEITPLTNEELKAWLPDNLQGMKRTSYKAGEAGMMGIASIEATFANEDKSKKFKIQVIDGAGQTGAAATMGMRMMMSQDFEEEDEYSSRKTITRKGKKAIIDHRKDNSRSKIQIMANDRFYIEADGENMSIDETWDALDKLNLDKLS